MVRVRGSDGLKLDWDPKIGGVLAGGGAGGSGRASAARTRGLRWWGYRSGADYVGLGEPLAALGSLGLLDAWWLVSRPRVNAPLGSACAAVTALGVGDRPTHTVSGVGGAGWGCWAGGGLRRHSIWWGAGLVGAGVGGGSLALDDLFRHRRRYGIAVRGKALQVQGHRLADAAQGLLTCGSLADATGE